MPELVICYRDELGIICKEIKGKYGVQFLNDFCYFDTTNGERMKIPIGSLVSIIAKPEV